jgi:hypothetical protein
VAKRTVYDEALQGASAALAAQTEMAASLNPIPAGGPDAVGREVAAALVELEAAVDARIVANNFLIHELNGADTATGVSLQGTDQGAATGIDAAIL